MCSLSASGDRAFLTNNIQSSWTMLAFKALLYGPVLGLTVLLHELGHCLATKQVRARAAVAHALSFLHAHD